MSPVNGKSTAQSRPPPRAAAELSVLVACHTFACAISTRYVMRLALDVDVDTAGQAHGVVRCDGAVFASHNLGSLLGLPPLTAAWVLLRVPRPLGHVDIALRTGPCLVVRAVQVEAPLPAGLFSSRGAAVRGAFVAGTQLGLDESMPYGLVLDIGGLWTEAELYAAEVAVGRVRARRRRG